jgi:hypothetical protein
VVDAVDVVGESRWLVGRKEAERPQTMQGGGKRATSSPLEKPGQLIRTDAPDNLAHT